MRTPRAESRRAALLALLTASVTAALLTTGGTSAGRAPAVAPGPSVWRGLVGSRPRVALGQRVIVVLRAPSLAQRVAAAGGDAGAGQERTWTRDALAAQRRVVARLASEGVVLRPDYSFARVLDGFSAVVDASGVALLERDPGVAGVYPVRVAYPDSVSTRVLSRSDYGPGSGHRAGLGVTGMDGRGVTIALLDTGVDPAVPYLRGRVLGGVDVIGRDPGALAAVNPDDPAQVERHGTEMAGLLVGAGGPAGLSGVATGASILPIRVAGWQPDGLGRWAIYARSDQLIAGLDRAVDPNDDGDAHDAARVALVALAEPFAAFADGPEARAVAGALALDTLVVAPAGNDGAAAPGYGDLSGPGGAPDALTVGALDARVRTDRVRVLVRSGLKTLLDTTAALTGAVRPARRLDLRLAGPRGTLDGIRRTAPRLSDFFTRAGASIVAGRAALVPAGASPAPAAERAAAAGAAAVVLYGGGAPLPAGGLGLDESVPVPVVSLTARAADAVLGRLAAGATASIVIGPAGSVPNTGWGRVASFSSTGLAFDGSVKPDLVAAGVALATADPGANADGSPRFVTVNGTSAAAAVVAGAAALLAQARPSLTAAALKALLAGSARPVAGDSVLAQGAGLVDVEAAIAGGLAASPSTLGVGPSAATAFTLTNLATHPVRVRLAVRVDDGPAAAASVQPARVRLQRGRSLRIRLVAGAATADGVVVATAESGASIRVPWAISATPSSGLIGAASLSPRAFAPSDANPALLSLDLGRVGQPAGRPAVVPLRQLDVDLARADGTTIGLLARMRDVLPGHYTFGVTGRGPDGRRLPRGSYAVKVVAYPVGTGPPSSRKLGFRLR